MAISRSFGATELTSRSPIRISPAETLSRPAIMASSVDFPQPDGPTSAMNSPVRASMLTPLRTSTAPKLLCRFRMVSEDMQASWLRRAGHPVASSFDRSLGQAADEIFAAEEIDEQRRQRADQHGGTHHVVIA